MGASEQPESPRQENDSDSTQKIDVQVDRDVRGNLIVAGRDAIVNLVGNIPGWALVAILVAASAGVLTLILTATSTLPALLAPTPTPLPTATAVPTITPQPTPLPTATPSVSEYELGVTVTYFTFPADGSVDAIEADTLVDQFDQRLQTELAEFAASVDVTLGHLGPSVVGRISGETPTEREADARQVAAAYGADMVVYGEITRSDLGFLELQPEFYVLPESFTEALEVTGSFRLGREIEIEGELTDISTVMDVNRPLSARTTALATIIVGLTQYAAEDYESALSYFEQAAALPDWEATEGREVLNVLVGNAYLRLASEAAFRGDADGAAAPLAEALAQYEAAAEIAPSYSRAYAGLGSASYLEGLLPTLREVAPDFAAFERALAYVQQGDKALDKPVDVGVNARRLYTQVQVYYALWTYGLNRYSDTELDGYYDDFQAGIDQIIRSYDDGNQPSVQVLASEVYALRGLAAQINGDCRNALDAYQDAFDLSISRERKMFFLGWQGDCHETLGQLVEAADAFGQALSLAQDVGNTVQADYYQARLDALDADG